MNLKIANSKYIPTLNAEEKLFKFKYIRFSLKIWLITNKRRNWNNILIIKHWNVFLLVDGDGYFFIYSLIIQRKLDNPFFTPEEVQIDFLWEKSWYAI